MPGHKKCEGCSHWQVISTDQMFGECKFYPPVTHDVLLMFRSLMFQSISPETIRQSTIWPVVTKDDYCDQWND